MQRHVLMRDRKQDTRREEEGPVKMEAETGVTDAATSQGTLAATRRWGNQGRILP